MSTFVLIVHCILYNCSFLCIMTEIKRKQEYRIHGGLLYCLMTIEIKTVNCNYLFADKIHYLIFSYS